jgi:hypothetical protein
MRMGVLLLRDLEINFNKNSMKNIILFLIVQLLLILPSNAQQCVQVGGNVAINTNVASALDLCMAPKSIKWNVTEQENCQNSIPKFYYKAKFTAVNQVHGDGWCGGFYAPDGSIPCNPSAVVTLRVYGPYADAIDYSTACQMIANYTMPVQTYTHLGTSTSTSPNYPVAQGNYIFEVAPNYCCGVLGFWSTAVPVCAPNEGINCANCLPSFSPPAGKYMVSAWVKEASATPQTVSYTNSSLVIGFIGSTNTYTGVPSGQIIDGWQRIEKEITIPVSATSITITLQTSLGTAYFDDVRFFPFDGSMMSYVYDPITLRLSAELDERNYATFYEYDEEGKLIRVKKETERGVMTIQENRDNIRKQ